MSQRDRYEPGVPCWVDTCTPDVHAAAGSTAALFGWAFEDRGEYSTAQLRDRDVAASRRDAGRRPAAAAGVD